jgi:TrkA-C domain
MAALISVFVVLSIAIVVTRVGAIALTHTGLSREVARFQARSAFLGVGFTTSESESIVNHPVRRRIAAGLILLGNAGLVGGVASLVLSFTRASNSQVAVRGVILATGLGLLLLLVRSAPVDRAMSRLIDAALRRWTDLDVRDYAELLELDGDYGVMELLVEEGDWLAGRTLAEAALRDEGIVVLGVHRAGGAYVGAPDGHTLISPGDSLTVYARTHRLCELDERLQGAGGDRAHADAVVEQAEVEERERAAQLTAASGRPRTSSV